MTKRIKVITEKIHEMQRLLTTLHNELLAMQSESNVNVKNGYLPYYMVIKYFDENYPAYKAKHREHAAVIARHVLMFILRNNSSMTFKSIGGLVGKLDHTTVIFGCQKTCDMLHIEDPVYTEIYNNAITYLCQPTTQTSSISSLSVAS